MNACEQSGKGPSPLPYAPQKAKHRPGQGIATLLFDPSRCCGCGLCRSACGGRENGLAQPALGRIRPYPLPSRGGTFCVFCRHCRHPRCLAACPQGAVSRDDKGIVHIDKSLCVNCGLCREACPEAAPTRTAMGDIRKCDLCVRRGQPACVAACPRKALEYSAGKKLRWISWLRLPVQALAFLLLAVVLVGSVCSLSIAAFDISCPTGALQNIFSSKTLLLTSLTATGVLVLVSLLAGRFFCGWVCPFGFVLDLVDKFAPRMFHLPSWLGNRTNKYGVLAGALISSAAVGNQAFCTVCPIGAVCRGYGLQSTLGRAEMAVVPLIASLDLAGKRSWCRYFCPVGAVFALFSRWSLLTVRINARRCRKFSCLRCADVCPVGIIPAADLQAGISPDINRAECISCLRCVDVCPYRAARLRLLPFALPSIANRKFPEPAPGPATASVETKA